MDGSFAERFSRPTRFTKRPVYVNGELIGHLLVDERPSRNERPLSMREFADSPFAQFLGPVPQISEGQLALPTAAPSPATGDLVAEVLEYVDPPLSNLQSSFQQSLWIAGVAAGFAGLLIVMMFTRQALAPVRGLTAAAGRLGAGDLSQRVPESGNDDIGELSRTFNAMATDLELAVHQRRRMTEDVAHELRTPLTNIQGYLEAIKDGVVQPDDETIETLHSQTIHLANLIEDLRILAVADAGALALNLSHGSPTNVIRDCVSNFAQRANDRNIELSVSTTGTDQELDFDETRLRQIVMNLVENALTYTPNNGRITVDLHGTSDALEMSVIDSGEGIPEEDLPRVFDQFYRADPSRNRATGGAGLGLTIVKRLVEAHRGTITASSTPGSGATFTVILPTSASAV